MCFKKDSNIFNTYNQLNTENNFLKNVEPSNYLDTTKIELDMRNQENSSLNDNFNWSTQVTLTQTRSSLLKPIDKRIREAENNFLDKQNICNKCLFCKFEIDNVNSIQETLETQFSARSWKDNWLFRKKNIEEHAKYVSMFVPNTTTTYRAMIGERDVDDISDLSEYSGPSDDEIEEELLLAIKNIYPKGTNQESVEIFLDHNECEFNDDSDLIEPSTTQEDLSNTSSQLHNAKNIKAPLFTIPALLSKSKNNKTYSLQSNTLISRNSIDEPISKIIDSKTQSQEQKERECTEENIYFSEKHYIEKNNRLETGFKIFPNLQYANGKSQKSLKNNTIEPSRMQYNQSSHHIIDLKISDNNKIEAVKIDKASLFPIASDKKILKNNNIYSYTNDIKIKENKQHPSIQRKQMFIDRKRQVFTNNKNGLLHQENSETNASMPNHIFNTRTHQFNNSDALAKLGLPLASSENYLLRNPPIEKVTRIKNNVGYLRTAMDNQSQEKNPIDKVYECCDFCIKDEKQNFRTLKNEFSTTLFSKITLFQAFPSYKDQIYNIETPVERYRDSDIVSLNKIKNDEVKEELDEKYKLENKDIIITSHEINLPFTSLTESSLNSLISYTGSCPNTKSAMPSVKKLIQNFNERYQEQTMYSQSNLKEFHKFNPRKLKSSETPLGQLPKQLHSLTARSLSKEFRDGLR